MPLRLPNPELRQCAYPVCGKDFTTSIPSARFCCAIHRSKAYHDANFIRRKLPKKPSNYAGPLCWCGAPGRYEGKCGNHNAARRYRLQVRRGLIRKLVDHLSIDELREAVKAGGFVPAIPVG